MVQVLMCACRFCSMRLTGSSTPYTQKGGYFWATPFQSLKLSWLLYYTQWFGQFLAPGIKGFQLYSHLFATQPIR